MKNKTFNCFIFYYIKIYTKIIEKCYTINVDYL